MLLFRTMQVQSECTVTRVSKMIETDKLNQKTPDKRYRQSAGDQKTEQKTTEGRLQKTEKGTEDWR